MISGPSGLYNAPLLKFLLVVSVGSFLLSVFTKNLHITSQTTTVNFIPQILRLITHYFFFSGTGETVTGMLLLYHFRLFERQMGSAKFAAFTLTTWVAWALLYLVSFVLIPQRAITSGPYGLIFALLVQYYFQVPATYQFRLFGIQASDKMIVYMLGIQLLCSNLPSSLLAGLAGVGAGLAYRSDAFPLKNLLLPSFILQFVSKWILPLLQTNQPYRPSRNLLSRQTNTPQFQHHGPPPSEATIDMLMDMGFTRENVLAALIQTGNDPELAAAILLDH